MNDISSIRTKLQFRRTVLRNSPMQPMVREVSFAAAPQRSNGHLPNA